MQAIALATGDEFLVPYNLTIDTENIEYYLLELTLEFGEKKKERTVHFDDRYVAVLMLVLGPSGYCYSFNVAAEDEVFNMDV